MSTTDGSGTGDAFEYSYWNFYPSKPLAIVAACLFGAALLVQIALSFRYKALRRMTPFVVGVALEVAGYAVRYFSIEHDTSRGLYIPTLLFIILAPAFMAATEYMIFGYLVSLIGPQFSPVRPSRVTFIFVFFDVLSLVVQGGGGGLFASDDLNVIKAGRSILLAGLCIQLVAFGIFGIFAIIFHTRIRRAGLHSKSVDLLLYTLYAGCFLILLRSIFRCVEFGASDTGNDGYLVTHEVYYYCLEALPIFITCIIFCISFPGMWLRRIEHEFPAPTPIQPSASADAAGGSSHTIEKTAEPVAGAGADEKTGRRWFGRRRAAETGV